MYLSDGEPMPWIDQDLTERVGADRLSAMYRAKELARIETIMAEATALRDRMSAICNQTNSDATDVAAFYEAATEWAFAQRKIWGG
jgi:hypothetical protein